MYGYDGSHVRGDPQWDIGDLFWAAYPQQSVTFRIVSLEDFYRSGDGWFDVLLQPESRNTTRDKHLTFYDSRISGVVCFMGRRKASIIALLPL